MVQTKSSGFFVVAVVGNVAIVEAGFIVATRSCCLGCCGWVLVRVGDRPLRVIAAQLGSVWLRAWVGMTAERWALSGGERGRWGKRWMDDGRCWWITKRQLTNWDCKKSALTGNRTLSRHSSEKKYKCNDSQYTTLTILGFPQLWYLSSSERVGSVLHSREKTHKLHVERVAVYIVYKTFLRT